MPVPDFSPGEVLTAAAMDSIGLWLVKTQTIGTAVSSVTVTGAFSSTYDNYQIILSGGQSSAAGNFLLQLGSATTEYYGSYYYDEYTGLNTGTARRNNNANLYVGTSGGTNNGRQQVTMTVTSPQKTERTTVSGFNYGSGFAGWFAGEQFSATSFTAFTILISTGTMTGGTIRVYGYRN
jgi:hypothetical protein